MKAQLKRTTVLSVRLKRQTSFDIKVDGQISAVLAHRSLDLGIYPATIVDRARQLKVALPCCAAVNDDRIVDAETFRLLQILSLHALVEYVLTDGDELLAVIEPQVSDYWPRFATLRNADILQLSRFAYLRRRDDDLVLESPLSGALFVIRNRDLAASLSSLMQPCEVGKLRKTMKSAQIEFLALLLDSHILEAVSKRGRSNLAASEDDELSLWDFHDLLFHTRSTEGRNANPVGATYLHAQSVAPAPAVRPKWPGKKIMLNRPSMMSPEPVPPAAKLLRQRHSTRVFDDQSPITRSEISRFLELTARIFARKTHSPEFGTSDSPMTTTIRPYPSAGGSYELELYLTVGKCDGIERGFYHYDADSHALVPIETGEVKLEETLARSAFAMGATVHPQILVTIAARFARVSWKYSSTAYALILKDVGVLTQTFYLVATELGLGGCAIGISDIDIFAKMTGLKFYIEGPVGQFAMGRPARSDPA